jgi:hypothetical protein
VYVRLSGLLDGASKPAPFRNRRDAARELAAGRHPEIQRCSLR